MSDDQLIDANKIGSGGFGTVYKYKCSEGDILAKKVLRRDADDESKKRFAREVELLSGLDHPNVIKVIDMKLDDYPLFFSMPLYKCSLRAEFPMVVADEERIKKIFGAVLSAVAHAHSRSTIHRDLKPENVLMNGDDDVVVSDFGLGLILDDDLTRLTRTGKELGTPFYMAPEQIEDFKVADKRSDIFSLGAILYELYTGRKVSPDMSSCPDTIRAVVERCVAEKPERRYQTVKELQNAFNSAITHSIDINAQERLEALIAQSSLSALDSSEIDEIGTILDTRAADHAFIFTQFERMDPTLVAAVLNSNLYQGQRLSRSYSTFVSNTSWNWPETEPIGARCEQIYLLTRDSKSKADLLFALLRLGYNHTRFVVMEQAETLFLQLTNPAVFSYLADLITQETSVAVEIDKRLSDNSGFRLQHQQFLENLLLNDIEVSPEDVDANWAKALELIKVEEPKLHETLVNGVRSISLSSRTLFLNATPTALRKINEEYTAPRLRYLYQKANEGANVIIKAVYAPDGNR